MGTQELLEHVIEKTCLKKVEVGPNAFKCCKKTIQNGFVKYYDQFPMDTLMQGDFMLQVLCHVLCERALLKNEMKTIIDERDAFKTKVDELKVAKAKLKATIGATNTCDDLVSDSGGRDEVANAKSDAGAESACDDSASDNGGRDNGEKQDLKKKLPNDKHRFTVVVAAAKVAYPEAFKECLGMKLSFQNRKKEVAKLKKRHVEVKGELEMEEHKNKKGMLKRKIAHIATKIEEKEGEASSLFKSGCEMANNLNTKVAEKTKSQGQQLKVDIVATNAIHKTVRKLNDQVEAQKKARREWHFNCTFEESLASVHEA